MMRPLSFLTALVCLVAAGPSTVHCAPSKSPSPAVRDDRLPPSEETAKAVLDNSPRHGEFVDVKNPSGGVPIQTWVVYPERKDKAGVVLIIHEIYGLSDWIRGVADQLAREGFIAVAPDLISGLGPGGGGTDSVPNRDDVVRLVRALTPEQVAERLGAVREYAIHLPSANGKIATLGFCWGGDWSFSCAATEPPPDAAVVFYGTSPDSARLMNVRAPVLGHYGGDDARVDATIEPARAVLAKRGRFYETHVYPGAGHGFLRAQALRDGANLRATRQAWPRTLTFLRKALR
jgi:carboxymethylenebutenolidase